MKLGERKNLKCVDWVAVRRIEEVWGCGCLLNGEKCKCNIVAFEKRNEKERGGPRVAFDSVL